ncbi:MAG: hypothetical protein JNJ58_11430 [Chitinophagaceae bacterium]|nr:hypothetical protein [Chitinophagaceae bacterium]
MKKSMIFSLLLFCGITAFTQTYKRKTPEEKARKYTDELTAVISLDTLQLDSIFLINVQVSKQFDSMYASKPDPALQKKATIAILKHRDTLYRNVMRPEQFLRYDDWQREKREQKWKEKMAKENAMNDLSAKDTLTTRILPQSENPKEK